MKKDLEKPPILGLYFPFFNEVEMNFLLLSPKTKST